MSREEPPPPDYEELRKASFLDALNGHFLGSDQYEVIRGSEAELLLFRALWHAVVNPRDSDGRLFVSTATIDQIGRQVRHVPAATQQLVRTGFMSPHATWNGYTLGGAA